ncbi:MAG: aroma-sacti cluster domain-containing protein [Candidatus Acidiferrales bacterium]
MDNLDKVAKAGVNLSEMSDAEKQVVQSLSPQEVDTLLKAKGIFEAKQQKAAVTSLKIL